MRAPVREHLDHPVGVAGDDHGLTAHSCREEVPGPGDLAVVSQHQPGPAEETVHLQLEQRRVGVDGPVDAVGLDEALDGLDVEGVYAVPPAISPGVSAASSPSEQ
jgi:hypothetical protein